MGLLSGLGQFGLSGLENIDVFEKQEKEEEKAAARKKTQEEIEQEIIFDKSCICPICSYQFKVKAVKNSKARLVGSDFDLRPRYENIDVLKYDVMLCTKCGYTALSRFFKSVTNVQAKLIKDNITIAYKPMEDTSVLYSYENALGRYKMALVNAIVKRAKVSERAYICLKTAWLLRGMGESLDKAAEDYAAKKAECETSELEFLKNAFNGFLESRGKESFPICGMDELTFDYLLAAIAVRFEEYDVASRLVSGIITKPNANARIKEKARDIKEMILKKRQDGNGDKT